MKIGILETGVSPPSLQARFGGFGDMMRRLLGPAVETRSFDVVANGPPPSVEACDGYLITGSAAGVNDGLPWIDPLIGFLRQARDHVPLVGMCFGHQLMAQAFGGRVIKSPKGWGIGLHRYRVVRVEPWMDPLAEVATPALHQDQVVALPPDARIILASDFTPIAGLAYGDRSAISFQGHPEFAPSYAAALVESRRGERFDDATVDAAVASLAQPNDGQRLAAWIRRFFAGHAGSSG